MTTKRWMTKLNYFKSAKKIVATVFFFFPLKSWWNPIRLFVFCDLYVLLLWLGQVKEFQSSSLKSFRHHKVYQNKESTLRKKWSFPLRMSSVNVTKSAVFFLVTFTEEIPNGKLNFLFSAFGNNYQRNTSIVKKGYWATKGCCKIIKNAFSCRFV